MCADEVGGCSIHVLVFGNTAGKDADDDADDEGGGRCKEDDDEDGDNIVP